MKLFAVVNVDDEYGHYDFIGAFSTPEKAQACIDELVNSKQSYWRRMVGEPVCYGNYSHNDGLTVVECELDKSLD